ncbi:MAG: hypothetical protein J6T11_06850 [Bacteroidaceae bacterium]|nr:hypothetical protein [Bacteroidaceae bacterium]
MNKTHSTATFPVHISVENKRKETSAINLLEHFMEEAGKKFDLSIVKTLSGNTQQAETVIAVPFADRENIRVDFNIYASEMEDKHGTGLYFHMESAF